MRDQLALLGVIGFALGILLASFLVPSLSVAGVAALIGSTCGVLFACTRRNPYLFVAVVFVAAALGVARVAVVPLALPTPYVPLLGSEVAFVGTVVAPPDVRETYQRLTLLTTYEGVETRILVVTDRHQGVHFGERIRAEGLFEKPEPFATDGGTPGAGRVFRYDRFLAKDGIFGVLSFAEVSVETGREGMYAHVFGAITDIKPAFVSGLETALHEPYAALAAGLIAGGKEGLGDALVSAFIATGLIHIVVLSGYNVMIVAESVRRFFKKIFGNARTREPFSAFLAGLAILLFVLAAGAGAASVRAGLMALTALFARATGRTYDGVRALLFVGVLMLLHNPLILAYDPGFQLSFVATLGLILGAPITERWISFVRIRFLREIIAATFAAQIAVLPLLLYQTGLLSLVALPANILVLPLVPFAMAASLIAALAGLLVPALAGIFGFPAYLALAYIIAIAEHASALPLASLTLPVFSFAYVLLAYALLGFFTRRAYVHAPWLLRTAVPPPTS